MDKLQRGCVIGTLQNGRDKEHLQLQGLRCLLIALVGTGMHGASQSSGQSHKHGESTHQLLDAGFDIEGHEVPVVRPIGIRPRGRSPLLGIDDVSTPQGGRGVRLALAGVTQLTGKFGLRQK